MREFVSRSYITLFSIEIKMIILIENTTNAIFRQAKPVEADQPKHNPRAAIGAKSNPWDRLSGLGQLSRSAKKRVGRPAV
jgi:hypothetical protein